MASEPRSANSFEAVNLILTRNECYKQRYRQLLKLCFGLIFIIALQTGFAVYLKSTLAKPVYFPITSDGQLLKKIPLNQPSLSTENLSKWIMSAAIKSYTFDFSNWRSSLQSTREYYTANGYQHFLKALKDSRNLEAVKNKKYVVSAVPLNLPTITPVPSDTHYSWQVKIPMLLTYQNSAGTNTIKQKIMMNMLIIRISNFNTSSGLAIERIIISEGENTPSTI